MSFLKVAVVAIVLVLCAQCEADMIVQLNVNRPFNDVNEKFVSFAVKPEDLYTAIDGPHRKSVTRMAALMGDSYIKFIGDYYFASNSPHKLHNPTKIIWKGFNRWTRAINWTMIIPVPYSTTSWDPMHALRILNSSHSVGISECVWQFGTDFESSSAQDYVTELNTFNLMVESFRPFVDDWQVMGADISAGSSPDETRRYIEMSKDINAAFGYVQAGETSVANSITNIAQDTDPALRTLLSSKVPVWLSLPPNTRKLIMSDGQFLGDETMDAIRWAQALGDAANAGYDAIFKTLTVSDLEKPNFSFYVTALFKKVMGSRVFPARPMKVFSTQNKLYTHCANSVSGGLAFMAVNTDDHPIQISVRSFTALKSTEVWQYTLTAKKNTVMLNNAKATLSSSLSPQIKVKSPDKPVQLTAPSMSVNFWVLPSVNVDHCQYTEVAIDNIEKDSEEKGTEKRFSSSDRLLRKLIQESSVGQTPLVRLINRGRRYATLLNRRQKRFVLEEKNDRSKAMGTLFDPIAPLAFDNKVVAKQQNDFQEQRKAAFQWLKNLFEKNPLKHELPLLKRGTRSTDKYFRPLFGRRQEKKAPLTKKITEIKKPERKVKPLFDLENFDEEEFFKKISERFEPEYARLPEGDVHLKHITNTDGDDIEDYNEEAKRLPKRASTSRNTYDSKESRNDMKSFRILPSEFYDAFPTNIFKPNENKLSFGRPTGGNKINFGNAFNSLLFPERKNSNLTRKSHTTHAEETATEPITELQQNSRTKYGKSAKLSDNTQRASKEVNKPTFDDEDTEREQTEAEQRAELQRRKYIDFLADRVEDYFGEGEETAEEKPRKRTSPKKDLEEPPWWENLEELSKKRVPRALRLPVAEDEWNTNLITKDEDLTPLGATLPEQLARYEYHVDRPVPANAEDGSLSPEAKKLLTSVKKKVSNFMDFVAHHVSDMYSTLKKHMETTTTSNAEVTTSGNKLK